MASATAATTITLSEATAASSSSFNPAANVQTSDKSIPATTNRLSGSTTATTATATTTTATATAAAAAAAANPSTADYTATASGTPFPDAAGSIYATTTNELSRAVTNCPNTSLIYATVAVTGISGASGATSATKCDGEAAAVNGISPKPSRDRIYTSTERWVTAFSGTRLLKSHSEMVNALAEKLERSGLRFLSLTEDEDQAIAS
ncbi:hypothetical protein BGZ80_004522 [Entomortierella chlamydospora]|uniref:Uncharacterized protein n=1 Tax=Entomortierella chlamydospora TaxID=101097 RepID=A0A9P6N6J1_9FUNG|nr:hypothetical protein BGZ80_004522 [Entomortierella chlamydospora]